MLNFLVDVNLPKYFQYFNHPNFIHVIDIDPFWSDEEVWRHALAKNLVILTKDTDYYNRFMYSDVSPKIVYFKFGNKTLSQLHEYFNRYWLIIQEKLKDNSFIIALDDELLTID